MTNYTIEIKAKIENFSYIRELLLSNQAVNIGVFHQVDTYFKVEEGRLKFRESGKEALLIHYIRDDIEGPKESEYITYNTTPSSLLKITLIKALGILVIVDKEREIFQLENVRFHFDTVENLGKFLEIEAFGDTEKDKNKLLLQCESYIKLFEIHNSDLIKCSYSNLLIDKIKHKKT